MNFHIEIGAMKKIFDANLVKRAVFGAIYVGVIVAGILCGQITLLLLLLLLSTLAINEFLNFTGPKELDPSQAAVNVLLRSLDCVGGAMLVVTVWTGQLFLPGLVTYLLYLMVRLCLQLWVTGQNALRSLALSYMSQLYIALPIALMSTIYRLSPHLLLLLFILVWVNDTFAFLTGCSIGKHKMWERISPKKTWEGLVGGILFTIITAALCGFFASHYFAGLNTLQMSLLGLVVGIAATLGDLVESLLKRTCGVKDSGNLIPGHGGILDRIDSILVVIPFAVIFTYLLIFNAF